MPAPPYKLVDNPHTWLHTTDLVFIDPIGTGYSRAVDEDDSKKYWNPKGDFESVGEFIRLYLTRFHRWGSPLFLAGESYGTTRAAVLAGYLVDKGIAFNGIILISTVLNFQTILFRRGNDLPHWLYVPTYAATAWYHGLLDKKYQKMDVHSFLREVEAWSESDYLLALAKGDRLEGEARTTIIKQLAAYTGLSETYIDQTNLRINIMRFAKELRRAEGLTVGRLDSRFTGRDGTQVSEFFEFDPSMVAITPPFTAMFNQYACTDLGYESDIPYETLSFDVNEKWEWDRGYFADTSEALRSAAAKNPFMHIFVARGLYDMATPHFAAEYTFDHMDLNPDVRDNVTFADYEAGHMLYLEVESLAQLKQDVAAFIASAVV